MPSRVDSHSRRFRGRWSLTVCCDGPWKVWLGAPTDNERQFDVRATPVGWTPQVDWRDSQGNRLWFAELEGDQRIGFEVSGAAVRRAPASDAPGPGAGAPPEIGFAPSPALDQLREQALDITGDAGLPPETALRRLFHYLLVAFDWRLTGFRRPLKQIAESLNGDCADAAMLFVAWAEALGIPGRPALGLLTEYPESLFQHVWPEFYIPGKGWLPCDVTSAQEVALQPAMAAEKYGVDDPMFFFGGMDDRCVVTSIGRCLPKRPQDGAGRGPVTIEEWSQALRREMEVPWTPLLGPHWIETPPETSPKLTYSSWEVS